ncbi:MAG: hypothetical protein ACFCUW_04310 [Kiloniellaceae bacterium]
MLRVVLTVLLPLAAPFLIYLGWLWLGRRKAAGGVLTVDWRETPWPWLLALGLAAALGGMLYLYLSTGHPPETKLAPPSFVDGVVVPSHPIE